MKSAVALLTLSFIVALMAVGLAGPPPKAYPTAITYVPAEKRLNAITKGNLAGQGTNELVPRDMDLGVRVSLGKKAQTPPVTNAEAHATFGHVYLIEEGEGTLVLGGEIVSPAENRPGEWTGPSIKGGREFHMKKGDMITVQVGMPHWWKDVPKGGVAYLAFHSFPDKDQPR
jgi:mannose-6-phosphate isomerase-like protein (cupin superfamily)